MNDNTGATGVKPATNQVGGENNANRQEGGQFGAGNNANPTGAGGFADNPENRSNGRWSKDDSITYWYNKLLRMPLEEYEQWQPKTLAERVAHNRLTNATGMDELALKATKEITDRTEGKPKQDIDMNIEGDNAVPLIKGFVIPTLPEDFIDKDIIAQGGKEHLK